MRQIQNIVFCALSMAFSPSLHAQTPGGVGMPVVWQQGPCLLRTQSNKPLSVVSVIDGKVCAYTTSSAMGGTLRMGGKPMSSTGHPQEHLAYARALSMQERQRVESHLALRYGITLGGNYLDSHGKIIWDGNRNKAFRHHVAGIAHDAASGLKLLHGASSEEMHPLQVTTQTLADGQSLLWGDDGAPAELADSKAHGKWVLRKWVSESSSMAGTPIRMSLGIDRLRQTGMEQGEDIYLAIDPSETGNFRADEVRYVRGEMNEEDSVVFHGIDAGSLHCFTFRVAGEMFTTLSVDQLSRDSESMGTATILVSGGVPPYRMCLEREGQAMYDQSSSDTLRRIGGLVEGRYSLLTTDKLGNEYGHEFQVSASGNMELPDDLRNARSLHDVFFLATEVTPNPTADGYVRIRLETAAEFPLTTILYTAAGEEVDKSEFGAGTYFHTTAYLPSPGTYLLRMVAGNHSKTIKLIRR